MGAAFGRASILLERSRREVASRLGEITPGREQSERRCPRLARGGFAVLLAALLAAYLFLLFFTPAIDAFGRRTLFDHHALLLPTPF